MRSFLSACRSLSRRPAFSLVTILTLAFGIATTTAVFSIVDTVVIKALPFPDGDRLVNVMETNPAKSQALSLIAPGRLEEWQQSTSAFVALAGWYSENVTDTSAGEPERLEGRRVTPRFFAVFGMRPLLGRVFAADEERFNGPQAAVISEGLWTRRYGRDPGVLGRRLVLGGQGYSIVGVMPRGFSAANVDVWLPTQLPPAMMTFRTARYLSGVGRMKPGFTVEQALSDLVRVQAALGQRYPARDAGWSASVVDMKERRVGEYRRAMTLVLAAVGFLLVIAIVNVAGLMLVQLRRRARELSIRQAIGGSRRQILKTVMCEVAVVTLCGAIGGGIGAWWLVGLLARRFATLPRINELTLDGRTFAFVAAVSAIASLVFGLWPALRATRGNLAGQLADAGRSVAPGRYRLQRGMVVAQIALTIALVVSAGVMLRSYYNLSHLETGLDPAQAITFHVGAAWNEDRTRVGQLQVRLVDELLQTPSVVAAGFANFLPATGGTLRYQITLEGRTTTDDNGKITIGQRTISGGYLPALGAHLIAGNWCPPLQFDQRIRNFTVAGSAKTIVNRAFTDRHGADVLGRRLSFDQLYGGYEIVGVIDNIIEDGPGAAAMPYAYVCSAPGAWPDPEYVVRVRGDLRGAMAAVRQVARSAAPDRAVFGMRPLDDVLAASLDQPRLNTTMLSVFALAALTLAALGLYTLLMLFVSERARELGVRMALGATPAQVVGLVMSGAARLLAGGLAIGLVVSVATARLLRSVIFGVGPFDLPTLVAAMATLVAVTLVAAAVPAHRAATLDPIDTMRAE